MKHRIEVFKDENQCIDRILELKTQHIEPDEMFVIADTEARIKKLSEIRGVHTKSIEDNTFWERIKGFFAGEETILDRFRALQIPDSERDEYMRRVRDHAEIVLIMENHPLITDEWNKRYDAHVRPASIPVDMVMGEEEHVTEEELIVTDRDFEPTEKHWEDPLQRTPRSMLEEDAAFEPYSEAGLNKSEDAPSYERRDLDDDESILTDDMLLEDDMADRRLYEKDMTPYNEAGINRASVNTPREPRDESILTDDMAVHDDDLDPEVYHKKMHPYDESDGHQPSSELEYPEPRDESLFTDDMKIHDDDVPSERDVETNPNDIAFSDEQVVDEYSHIGDFIPSDDATEEALRAEEKLLHEPPQPTEPYLDEPVEADGHVGAFDPDTTDLAEELEVEHRLMKEDLPHAFHDDDASEPLLEERSGIPEEVLAMNNEERTEVYEEMFQPPETNILEERELAVEKSMHEVSPSEEMPPFDEDLTAEERETLPIDMDPLAPGAVISESRPNDPTREPHVRYNEIHLEDSAIPMGEVPDEKEFLTEDLPEHNREDNIEAKEVFEEMTAEAEIPTDSLERGHQVEERLMAEDIPHDLRSDVYPTGFNETKRIKKDPNDVKAENPDPQNQVR